MACASHFLINDDIKIVRTPKNMAASVVNLPGMTLQPLYIEPAAAGSDSCVVLQISLNHVISRPLHTNNNIESRL